MRTAYGAHPQVGTLGSIGLGALTYPSWIPQTCKNCSASTLERWKAQVAFAMGWYDIFRSLEKFPTPAQAERFKRFGSYGKPELAMDPNNKFWASAPDRVADHADIVKQALRHGSFHSSTSFDPIGVIKAEVGKIPVVGDAANIAIDAFTAPIKIATNIASGARLDHVALAALKDQVKIVREAAPYAQTVLALVPGVGTGAAAAIAAGAALAEGQSITAAAKAAIRGAIPGGVLGQAAFDTAMKVAAGENVGLAALESSRALVPPGAAQKAYDIGVALATGEKLQTALAKGLMSIAPGQLQTILATGQKALETTPGLKNAFSGIAPGAAQEGFTLAAGLLGHQGLNEKALTAVRGQLPPEVRAGFDAALQTQVAHLPWLKNVTSTPPPVAVAASQALRTLDPPKKAPAVAPPKMLDPPKKAVAPAKAPLKTLDPPKKAAPAATPVKATAMPPAYAPYPQGGALSGPAPECRKWGPPVTDMTGQMRHAGLTATARGPRVVLGPDGGNYLFQRENGTLTARRCVG